MRPVDRALFDPFLEDRDILGLHGLGLALGRLRHEMVRVMGFDAFDEFALFGMTGNDGIRVAGAFAEGGFFEVKSQAAFAHFGIWTVAAEAIAGEYRLNVLIEI
jgi:hypothetical protein